jgi:arylsulfatase A-like enzyme
MPGRFERAWCDSPVNCTDFLPTFASLTGNDAPADIDGQNITALLDNPESDAPERTIIWHYPFNVIVKHPDNGLPLTPHSAIRVGDYKLIWDWHGKLELYDVPDDPYEQNDLSAAMPEKTDKMFRELREWLEENVEERYFPRRNPNYDPAKDERGYPFRDLREKSPGQ